MINKIVECIDQWIV